MISPERDVYDKVRHCDRRRHHSSSQEWRRNGLGRGIARTRSSHQSASSTNPASELTVSMRRGSASSRIRVAASIRLTDPA